MAYTKIPEEFRERFKKKYIGIDLKRVQELAKRDPAYFAYFYFGKKCRLHQAYILEKLVQAIERKKIRLAICLARQLGKTTITIIVIIWMCWFNKIPVSIAKLTMIYVVSRDDDTAMEIIEKIRFLLYEGDKHMSKYNDGFFSNSIKEPNNTHQITFLNGNFVKSIPPTKKALGKSASLLFIDEAHRLNCTDIDSDTFFDYAVAMVSETGGGIVLSSSPEGTTGFFYRAIDPNNTDDKNEFERIWFKHDIWSDGSIECERYNEFVQSEKVRLTLAGRLKFWQQEYEALFTVTETNFFELSDIENATTDTVQMYEYKEGVCVVGIDYGLKTSRTVITIRTVINNEIIQIFQYRSYGDFDNGLLINDTWEHSIQNLRKRYNIGDIITDDCPQGDTVNRWIQKNIDIPLRLYNFRSDQMSKQDGINRNCAAYSYRAKLKEGILKIPRWNAIQRIEMSNVKETENKTTISIKSISGNLCDTFDSDMMASIPFLDIKETMSIKFDTEEEEEKPVGYDRRSAWYDDFHSLTEEECREMLRQIREEY